MKVTLFGATRERGRYWPTRRLDAAWRRPSSRTPATPSFNRPIRCARSRLGSPRTRRPCGPTVA